MSSYSVIITAGGIGKRMNLSLPKQFIVINEKPLLMYTIEKFYHFDPKFQIIITLPDEWKEYWEALIVENKFNIPHRVVSGGEERYHSIKNALSYCYGDSVWIHDGVRPLVNEKTLNSCAKAIRKHDAVIPIIAVPDSLRRVQGSQSNAVPRSEYVFVQTPQCFKRDVILKAYNIPFSQEITDDASLVEQLGVEIKSVQGNVENIKITNKFDVKFAELYLD